MGKLPGLFFRQTGTSNVNRKALKLFPLVYLLLSALPITLIIISFFQKVALYNSVLLAAVLGFSVYSGIIRRQTLRGSGYGAQTPSKHNSLQPHTPKNRSKSIKTEKIQKRVCRAILRRSSFYF